MNYENLTIKDFCCEDCLLDEMLIKLEESSSEDSYGVSLYANAEVIDSIFKKLLELSYNMAYIDFDGKGFDYNDTYVLTITDSDDVWIEPVYRNDKPIYAESEVSYLYEEDVHQDLIDRLLEANQNIVLFSLGISEDTDINDEEELFQEFRDDDGKLTGFEFMLNTNDGVEANTYYRFTSNNEETVKSVMDGFLGKYTK